LRYQARIAAHREERARALYEFARDLSSLLQTGEVIATAAGAIARTFRADVALFIPDAEEKLRRVVALVGGRPIDIEIDGGVTAENAGLVARAGANALVAGTAVFKGGPSAYRANIDAIRNAAALARGEAA